MKIKSEHLAHMRTAMALHDTPFHRGRYAAAGLSDERYQWDLLRHAGLMPWLGDTLYLYLNDSHIESAMRSFIKPLTNEAAK